MAVWRSLRGQPLFFFFFFSFRAMGISIWCTRKKKKYSSMDLKHGEWLEQHYIGFFRANGHLHLVYKKKEVLLYGLETWTMA